MKFYEMNQFEASTRKNECAVYALEVLAGLDKYAAKAKAVKEGWTKDGMATAAVAGMVWGATGVQPTVVKTTETVEQFLSRNETGTFLIFVKGHVIGFKNGRVSLAKAYLAETIEVCFQY